MRRSPLCYLVSLSTEAGMCLTCSSHSCGGNRDVRPLQTRFDIRTVGPGDSQTPVPVSVSILLWNRLVQFSSHSLQSARTSRVSHSFCLILLGFFTWPSGSRSCIVRCVDMSFILAVFIVLGLSFHCHDNHSMLIVHCSCLLSPFKLSLRYCVITLRHHDVFAQYLCSSNIPVTNLRQALHLKILETRISDTTSFQFYNSRISNRLAGLAI